MVEDETEGGMGSMATTETRDRMLISADIAIREGMLVLIENETGIRVETEDGIVNAPQMGSGGESGAERVTGTCSQMEREQMIVTHTNTIHELGFGTGAGPRGPSAHMRKVTSIDRERWVGLSQHSEMLDAPLVIRTAIRGQRVIEVRFVVDAKAADMRRRSKRASRMQTGSLRQAVVEAGAWTGGALTKTRDLLCVSVHYQLLCAVPRQVVLVVLTAWKAGSRQVLT
jgi:hypothetical protein